MRARIAQVTCLDARTLAANGADLVVECGALSAQLPQLELARRERRLALPVDRSMPPSSGQRLDLEREPGQRRRSVP